MVPLRRLPGHGREPRGGPLQSTGSTALWRRTLPGTTTGPGSCPRRAEAHSGTSRMTGRPRSCTRPRVVGPSGLRVAGSPAGRGTVGTPHRTSRADEESQGHWIVEGVEAASTWFPSLHGSPAGTARSGSKRQIKTQADIRVRKSGGEGLPLGRACRLGRPLLRGHPQAVRKPSNHPGLTDSTESVPVTGLPLRGGVAA